MEETLSLFISLHRTLKKEKKLRKTGNGIRMYTREFKNSQIKFKGERKQYIL